MNNILIADTDDCELGVFFQICSDMVLKCGLNDIKFLYGKNVSEISLSIILKTMTVDCDLVAIFCHGSPDSILGTDRKSILDVTMQNITKFKNSIIYSFSCSVGSKLGPELIKYGCKTFIGYSGVVRIVNKYEKEFANCVGAGVEQLIAGSSSDIAVKSVIHQYKKLEKQVDFLTGAIINDNIDKLVVLGDPHSTLIFD